MLGGISDKLIIGFNMSGDDKACLTVARRKGRGCEIIKQFFDLNAEYLYEQLSDNRVMSRSRSIPSFIDTLVDDLLDEIEDYRDSMNHTRDIERRREYAIMIRELRRQVASLRELRKEYEEG